METAVGIFNGLPTWAKIMLFLLVWVGPLLFTTAFYLGQNAGWIPSPSSAMLLSIQHMQEQEIVQAAASAATAQAAAVMMAGHEENQKKLMERLVVGFRVICMNAATTPKEMQNCQLIQ